MCTLTVLPVGVRGDGAEPGTGLRVVMNRDEQRDRPLARPPAVRRHDGLSAIYPVDPPSGGTWIAVNSAGLVLALLNSNPYAPGEPRPDRTGLRSRGEIIPSLLGCRSADDAVALASRIDGARFPPFRLVALDVSGCSVLHRIGPSLRVDWQPVLTGPIMLTSSGLGDAHVEPPRRALFERTLAANPSAEAQDAFHASTLPGDAERSVLMTRHDARTVSRCVVEVGPAHVRMAYVPIADRVAAAAAAGSAALASTERDA
jgi:hypothetical protein